MSTSPTVQDVVGKVCSIPSDQNKRGDVSVVYLLEESGYDSVREAVTVPLIQRHLQAHPHLMDVWADYSADQRCSGGWFFDHRHSTTGYYTSRAGQSHEQVFSNRSQACAEFIKHELESWRENPAFGSGQKSLGSRRRR